MISLIEQRIQDGYKVGRQYKELVSFANTKLDLEQFQTAFLPAWKFYQKILTSYSDMTGSELINCSQLDMSKAKALVEGLRKAIGKEDFNLHLAQAFSAEVKSIWEQIKTAWDSHVKNRIGDIDGLLVWLSKRNIPNPYRKRMDDLAAIISTKTPGNKEAISALDQYIKLAENFFSESSIDESVKKALLKLSQGNATLMDLDEDAFRWCIKNKLAAEIKLSLINQQGT